jgi:hypothetical protein
MSGLRQPGGNKELVNTVGTTLAVTPHDVGKVLTNLGNTGNVAYTFQTAANFRPGDQIWVLSCDDGTVTVNFTAGQLITFNNAAAGSVAIATGSEIIGGGFIFTCLSASKWHCAFLTEESQTVTVA